ncbi:Melibiase family protein [Thalictrum thalictroides]|uniref:Melibiase family protein n=1 Tax=Thalictrum thalictroides TaxID=46969 RepID=A0A7J6W284_THATH|nr:Melibiase family protein [Thalictrum thalictroides]
MLTGIASQEAIVGGTVFFPKTPVLSTSTHTAVDTPFSSILMIQGILASTTTPAFKMAVKAHFSAQELSEALRDGHQANTPPRGWNSYDSFSWTISEAEFLQNAEVLSQRLKVHGYQYAVLDYLWYRRKVQCAHADSLGFDVIDEWGRMVPDPDRWPSSGGGKGLTVVAKKLHDMGLRFGIHGLSAVSCILSLPELVQHQQWPRMYRVTGDDWDKWGDVASHFDVSRDFAAANMIGAEGLQGNSWPDIDMLPIGWLTDRSRDEEKIYQGKHHDVLASESSGSCLDATPKRKLTSEKLTSIQRDMDSEIF